MRDEGRVARVARSGGGEADAVLLEARRLLAVAGAVRRPQISEPLQLAVR